MLGPETAPEPQGSLQALDQIATWVRFADTKATILTAGLGVVLTVFMGNVELILEGFFEGAVATFTIGTLAVLTLSALIYTLLWLVYAIAPSSGSRSDLNRFAWPTLAKASVEDLYQHTRTSAVSEDAWKQVLDLSRLAERKFHACSRAVWGFVGFVLLAVTTVLVATAISAM